MSKSYIIETNDETQLIVEIGVNSTGAAVIATNPVSFLTPYTEPDTQQVNAEKGKIYDEARARGYDEGRARGYQEGLFDAWEAARKIVLSREDGGLFSYEERKAVFGCGNYTALKTFLAPEAIEKIRQYEQEKEGLGIQGYFKRGDEVIDADGTKAVILRVSEDNYCQVYTKNGRIYNWHIHTYKFHKTGRHFPEIAEVLRKMKGETDGQE